MLLILKTLSRNLLFSVILSTIISSNATDIKNYPENCALRIFFSKADYTVETTLTMYIYSRILPVIQNIFILEPVTDWKTRLGIPEYQHNKFFDTQILPTKFIQCYSVIVFQDSLIKSFLKQKNTNVSIASYIEAVLKFPMVYTRNEDPKAVIFITEIAVTRKLSDFYSKLFLASITSTFFVSYFTQLFLICEICEFNSFFNDVTSGSDIDVLWYRVHRYRTTPLYFKQMYRRADDKTYLWIAESDKCDYSLKYRYAIDFF